MDTYERLYKNSEINMILDNINEMLNKAEKGLLRGCHGRYHTMFVVDTVEYILKSLSYDSKTVECGKIAALLHDIGNIAGRRNHARKSAVLAVVFLEDSEDLLPSEKKMIVQAIEDHTDGENISSALGAALFIADKVDASKRRRLTEEPIDDWYNNLLEIQDVEIRVVNKTILIHYVTTEAFSKNMFINRSEKSFSLMKKAAEYLGFACRFRFNGIE